MNSPKFKLSTIGHGWGRVKGWKYTSPLIETMKRYSVSHKDELIVAIKAELVKGEAKLIQCTEDIHKPYASERTRRANNAWARYNRADDKVRALKDALDKLTA